MRQTIEVDILATSEATIVEAKGGTYLESGLKLTAQGTSKKHPKDEHDCEIGHSLAMARALRELADAYEQRAQFRIDYPAPTYAAGDYITNPEKVSREFYFGNLTDLAKATGSTY